MNSSAAMIARHIAMLAILALSAGGCTDREAALKEKLHKEAIVRCNYARFESPDIIVAEGQKISKKVIRGQNSDEPDVSPIGECKPKHTFSGQMQVPLLENGGQRSTTVTLFGGELKRTSPSRELPSTENWNYVQRYDLYIRPTSPQSHGTASLVVHDIGPKKQSVFVFCQPSIYPGNLFLENFDTLPALSICEGSFIVSNLSVTVRYDPKDIPFTKELFNNIDKKISSSITSIADISSPLPHLSKTAPIDEVRH